MKLTDEQKKKYIESGGDHCPYCGSKDIEGTGDRDADSNQIECLNCEKTWFDKFEDDARDDGDYDYTVTDIEEAE